VNWLKTRPEIFRIGATTDAENHRSMQVLEAVGLVKEGVLRRATVRPNIGPERRDTVFFSWLKPDETGD
jgi:RimJ/RimL family protein N-acetyltransferase